MPDPFAQFRKELADTYAIEREIGRGGMATVYLAQDLKHDRQVAVKVLLPELSTSLGTQRFLREVKIAAGLQHPHILPIYDSGEAAGLLYYVMPYVEGHTLRYRSSATWRTRSAMPTSAASYTGTSSPKIY
jgi:serine/threonine-protein kinase